jgi:hypothetical protein
MKNTLPGHLIKDIERFIENGNVQRLGKNLRNLFLSTLIAQKDGNTFDMDDMLVDLSNLFQLLDAIETYQQSRKDEKET